MADLSLNDSVDLGEISKLKVADLKKELKSRGLSTIGNKTELIERLQLAFEDGQGLENDSELLDDDDVLAEDDALDDDLSEPKSEETSPMVLGAKRKAVTAPTEPAALPIKKIVLNRAAVASAEKENQDEAKVGADKLPEVVDPDKKAVVKITALTAQERLEMRASKFGVALSADAKKEARAARFGITPASTGSATSITAGTAPPNVETLKKRADRFGSSVASALTKVELDEKMKKRQERFGVVEPTAANGKSKPAVTPTVTPAVTPAVVKVVSTSSSTSVKVPITMGGLAPSTSAAASTDKKKQRAERFKATL